MFFLKILWLCNTLIPELAEKLSIKNTKPESWITGIYNKIKKEDINLVYLFPVEEGNLEISIDKSVFVSYVQKNSVKFEKEQITAFEKIINDKKPDVIHIFGTEFPHTFAMIKAAENKGMLDKTIINIQGLVSVYAKHFYASLDNKTVRAYTFRDFVKRNNIHNQRLAFVKRGIYEEKALRLSRHVIGRTDWDKACVTRVNHDINYHFCNETLRKPFYENSWDIEKCEKHSIFVSQSNYPIKGFHYMLEAMADIVKIYPDAHLYTTGNSPLNLNFNQKIRQGYYSKYLGKLIKKYNLENNVTFLGYLDEDKMCERFLKSNVFVCCSSIENSPNSVGEAMILGVPVVTSDMCGVKNMLPHEKEGFVYQADAPYMLSYYIKKIFENRDIALKFSENAKQHAKETHNEDKNFKGLIKIYKEIMK